MADRMRRAATRVDPNAKPTRWGGLVFGAKVLALRARRGLQNLSGPRKWGSAPFDPVWTKEHRSPLWTSTDAREQGLQMGKIHNLRVALRSLDGVVIPAGQVFSFWRQVGQPVRRKGFVDGRELREGCIIATPGGGLCQLSNALYQLALDAGLEIVERHPHTQVVPGSASEIGRDATVAWNHIDLRFRHAAPFRFRCRLTASELIVSLELTAAPTPRSVGIPLRMVGNAPGSCETCGEEGCHRHDVGGAIRARTAERRRAFVLDAPFPEFQALLASEVADGDQVLTPLRRTLRTPSTQRGEGAGGEGRSPEPGPDIQEEGALRTPALTPVGEGAGEGAPPGVRKRTEDIQPTATAFLPALRRAYRARSNAPPPIKRAWLLADTREIALTLGRRLSWDSVEVAVDIALLAPLWSAGVLGGRSVEVWVTRWPLKLLHEALDRAAETYPEAALLRDFRASDAEVEEEWEALLAAGRVATPHPFLAARFREAGLEVRELPWILPTVDLSTVAEEGYVYFPGPTASREGARAVRAYCLEKGMPVSVGGRNREAPDFWDGVTVLDPQEFPMERASLVMCPAVAKSRPTEGLQAIALGKRVIATPESGLSGAKSKANLEV